MTPAEHAEKSRREQGLPKFITDPAILARVAAMIDQPAGESKEAKRRGE